MESLAVCLVGGKGGVNNFTKKQWETLDQVIWIAKVIYPDIIIKGHREFSKDVNHDGVITPDEWYKLCPSFDVQDFLHKRGEFEE